MINICLISFYTFYTCFFFVNGNFIFKKTFIIIGSTAVYEYFFAETFTVADFINSGWLYSESNILVSTCAGKSIVG